MKKRSMSIFLHWQEKQNVTQLNLRLFTHICYHQNVINKKKKSLVSKTDSEMNKRSTYHSNKAAKKKIWTKGVMLSNSNALYHKRNERQK